MLRTFIACFLFFVISSVPAVSMTPFFNWHFRSGISLYTVKNCYFDTKVQPAETFQTGFLFSIGDHVGIETTLGIMNIHQSDLTQGYQYRGLEALLIRISLQGRTTLSQERRDRSPRLGLEAGMELSYAHYTATKIYLFYPTIYTAPFLDLFFSKNPQWNLRFLIPVRIALRIDMDYVVGTGIGIAFLYRPSI